MASGQQVDSLHLRLNNATEQDKAQILIELCDAHMNYDNDAALSYAEEAVEAAANVKDTARLLKGSVMRAELLTAFERFVEARTVLEQALELATECNDVLILSDIHGAFGGLYFDLFDYEQSLYHYKLATDLARQTGNVSMLVKNMNNMASLFEVQGDFKLALKAFVECSDVLEGTEWENHRIYFIALMNSGMVCNSMGDYESAAVYLKRSLAGFIKLNLTSLEAHAIVGLVHTYTKLGQLDSAMSYYQRTLGYKDAFELASRKHFKDQIYAELLFEMERYQEVVAVSKRKLEEIGLDTNFTIYAVNAAKLAYTTYKKLGNEKEALFFLERHMELNSYNQSKSAEEQVQSLRTRFETELDFGAKQREILELQLRESEQQKQIDKQRNWRNFILSISALGLLISLLILYNLKLQNKASEAESERLETENSKLQMDVEHKNRELTTAALFVAQKNQMLMNLQERLAKLFKSTEGVSSKEFRTIKNQIMENIRLEEDWERIKLHFEEVYPDFFTSIKASHDRLTPLELKHCAYLRMGLSVKEVARMLSVAPASVQMSHYRLKKKLRLDTDDSLRNYMEGF